MRLAIFLAVTIIALTLSVSPLLSNQSFAQSMMSPRTQMQSNPDISQLSCNEGHVLITKTNGMPACVSTSTYLRLIDRGWGMWDSTMMMNHPQMRNNLMNQMIQDPQMMQPWHDMMLKNQQQMQETRNQWIEQLKDNPQLMANMMGPMTTDPKLQQQMIDQMMQHRDMMQSIRDNPNWMGMMHGSMMGQGMGSGMGMHGNCPWCSMQSTPQTQYGTPTCAWCPVTNQTMGAKWTMHNPQNIEDMMHHMWVDPELRQQMHDMMIQNPWHMGLMMNQMMGSMMGPMMNDPQIRQQMLDMMSQNQGFVQNLKQNPQFLDETKEGVVDDDKDDDKRESGKYGTQSSSQNTPVSIVLGSASPGCETTNECYIPYSVSIKEYSSVTWTNDDMAVHTATSGTPSNGPNGIFDSGLISPGDTYTNQFNEEGTFNYYCIAHPWMTGKVIVVDD